MVCMTVYGISNSRVALMAKPTQVLILNSRAKAETNNPCPPLMAVFLASSTSLQVRKTNKMRHRLQLSMECKAPALSKTPPWTKSLHNASFLQDARPTFKVIAHTWMDLLDSCKTTPKWHRMQLARHIFHLMATLARMVPSQSYMLNRWKVLV